MYDQAYKRGGFRGSPRGGRGGRGGWGQGGGYYGGGQVDGGYRGGRGGYNRGGRGGNGGYRNDTGAYRGGGGGGYRGGYRGGQQQYQQRGGYQQGGGFRGAMGRGGMGGFPRGGGGGFTRGGFDQSRIGPAGHKGRGGMNPQNRKTDAALFEENMELSRRKCMVKVIVDNKFEKADFEELIKTEGVVDVHLTGHLMAEFEEDKEDIMVDIFPEIEQIRQNGVPCFADLTGRRSKLYGKESVRDLRRVDVRNLPEKTTIEMVKEAFPSATAVWRNHKQNHIELLFKDEEEACEAILSGQQKEINGTLPYVMFHRENQAMLTKRQDDEPSSSPPSKKIKVDDSVDANGEAMDGVEEATPETSE